MAPLKLNLEDKPLLDFIVTEKFPYFILGRVLGRVQSYSIITANHKAKLRWGKDFEFAIQFEGVATTVFDL